MTTTLSFMATLSETINTEPNKALKSYLLTLSSNFPTRLSVFLPFFIFYNEQTTSMTASIFVYALKLFGSEYDFPV